MLNHIPTTDLAMFLAYTVEERLPVVPMTVLCQAAGGPAVLTNVKILNQQSCIVREGEAIAKVMVAVSTSKKQSPYCLVWTINPHDSLGKPTDYGLPKGATLNRIVSVALSCT